MFSHGMTRFFSLLTIVAVLLGFGCSAFLKPEIGDVAKKEARIALTGQKSSGVWQTGDLLVEYTFETKGQQLSLTGEAVIDRSIRDSFPVITSFFLFLSFLDAEGRTLDTVDISPVKNTYGLVPDSMPLAYSAVPPAGARAVAFNYLGGFRANPVNDGGHWDIFHFPFN